ncbi:MAG: hypothetical protein JSU87_00230 [Gemmatimonadota bacterium]|nr:MAG: hypothetical protein JSU87_00230 [Gemmatimonadota bacterium]
MAEGHSVLRWATALRSLIGEPLVAVDAPQRWATRAAMLPGAELCRIGTHGKHLLLHLSNDITIHCHAMMYGSWQFGPPEMALRKPEKNVRLRLRTRKREAVFFNGPVVELLTAQELESHEKLRALGPDLLHVSFDREETWRRLQEHLERPIGDAILDQQIVAGIGNIFKSEGLFLAAIDPRTPTRLVPPSKVGRLWDILIPLMLQNARRAGPVVTLNGNLRRGGERYWVYQRSGRLCFRCNAPIAMIRQGKLKRTSFFCANCQEIPKETAMVRD